MLSGIDAEAVAICAAEVVSRVASHGPLPLRGGLARGPGIMLEGDDYVGFPVNLAARLCRVAPPNHVLAAADALDRDAAARLTTVPRRLEGHDLGRGDRSGQELVAPADPLMPVSRPIEIGRRRGGHAWRR
jgi:class 3 adenylate cyclase